LLRSSIFFVYDLRTQNPKEGFACVSQTLQYQGNAQAHKPTAWAGKHLPQKRDLWMTTAGDGTLSLWKYSYPQQRKRKDSESGLEVGVAGTIESLASTEVTTQAVMSIDWNLDFEGLFVCCALDSTVKAGVVTKLKNY